MNHGDRIHIVHLGERIVSLERELTACKARELDASEQLPSHANALCYNDTMTTEQRINPRIVTLYDKHDEHAIYYRIVTSDERIIEELRDEAAHKNIGFSSAEPQSPHAALRFLRQL